MQTKQTKQKLQTRDVKSGALTYKQYKVGDTFYDERDMFRMMRYKLRDANRLINDVNKNPSNNDLVRKLQSTINMVYDFNMSPNKRIKEDGMLGNNTINASQEIRSMVEKMSSDLVFKRISRDEININMEKNK